jgi:hypothetical protein
MQVAAAALAAKAKIDPRDRELAVVEAPEELIVSLAQVIFGQQAAVVARAGMVDRLAAAAELAVVVEALAALLDSAADKL